MTGRERWDDRLAASTLRKDADRAWGADAQVAKAAEEFAEVAAALSRHQNGQQDRAALLEELADARLMLWQIELMFTEDELEDALDDALDDLAHRLEVSA